MSDTILHADGLYHVYESKAEDGNVVALRGLHIDMKAGEAIAVVGPSGSGKSTLMKCLGGLMKPSAGSVSLAGKNMTRLTGQELVELRQKTVSFIFQEGNLLPDLNARDNVAQPLRHQGVSSKKALALADAMLDGLDLLMAVEDWDDEDEFYGSVECWLSQLKIYGLENDEILVDLVDDAFLSLSIEAGVRDLQSIDPSQYL